MSTAPAGLPAEMRLVASIRALKAARQVSTEDLIAHLHIGRSTWFEKMRTGQFTVAEAITLADFFGLPLQALVDGHITLPKLASKFELVPGGARQSAPISHARPLMNPVPASP